MSEIQAAPVVDRARGLGRIGVWSAEMRFGDKGAAADAAAELEALGYGAIWVPGAFDAEVLLDVERLLGATERLPIATGILNIWKLTPEDVGAWWSARSAAEQGRLMLGLGVSHELAVGAAYSKPL